MKCEKGAKNEVLENAVTSYIQTKSELDKQFVVEAGEALVSYYASLYSPGKTDEDLRQAGYEGLLKALKRFKPELNVTFSTYASHCIIGEIRHELRDRGTFKIPEWMKGLQSKIINATEEMAQKNGSMPTLKEIAHRVNVAEEGIIEAMQAGCVSLDEIDLSKVKHLRYESFKLPIEDRIAVQMSIEKMDQLQQQVVKLIYYEGLTQEETAKRLGLNQRKVSRLLNRSLIDMREYVMV
ncbi:MAG: sigma-70 family RNA polymerase sigma factor [Bacillota bacterium]|nr:sigma-70 family RNA polymerase sigma factor [Bacillota bacterium]